MLLLPEENSVYVLSQWNFILIGEYNILPISSREIVKLLSVFLRTAAGKQVFRKIKKSVDKSLSDDYNIQAIVRGCAMHLDLRKIIHVPGEAVAFECELNGKGLDFPSVSAYLSAPRAKGRVFNEAGILHLEAEIEADMLCICDRCGEEFESVKVTEVDAVLSEEESPEDPDLFVLVNDGIDLDEVLSTCFILDMETKFLCSENCKGLCPSCGKNLNLGPCGCRKEIDPRFAVLEQLLDK